jgi:hypothetical protein
MSADDETEAPMSDAELGLDFEVDDGSTVHHLDAVDLRSLGLVAALFYFTAFLVLALAIVGVWLFAAGLGLISQVEDFMRSVGFRGFHLVGPEVILGFVLILAALVVFLTVMTLVAGAFYNLLGTTRHGVRVRTSVVPPRVQPAAAEDEPAPSATPFVFEPVVDSSDEADAEPASDEKPEAVAG